jgi:creatinine amidohydrolase
MEAMSSERVLLQEMKWPEIRDLVPLKPIVIIPTGSIEQHGPHLPLEVDSRIAKELAYASAQTLHKELPVVVAPGLDIGFSSEHLSFPGTLSLDAETFMRVASQVVVNLIGHGFERFLFLNGHGGNEEALRLVARTLREKHEVLIAATSYWQLAREEIKALRQSPGSGINHGGEEETALMLHLRPQLVDMSLATAGTMRWCSSYLAGSYDQEAQVAYGRKRTDIAPLGHGGDPSVATAEEGKKMFEAIVQAIVQFVREFHTWRIEEMGRPRS